MNGISLRIALSLMYVLFGIGYVCFNGATGSGAVLGQEFKIKYGQELTIKGQGLKVKFASVLDDSRCAVKATCVWAGDAKIVIRVRQANAKESRMELHTNGTQAGKYQQY